MHYWLDATAHQSPGGFVKRDIVDESVESQCGEQGGQVGEDDDQDHDDPEDCLVLRTLPHFLGVGVDVEARSGVVDPLEGAQGVVGQGFVGPARLAPRGKEWAREETKLLKVNFFSCPGQLNR